MKSIAIEDLITAVRLVKKDTCEDFATTNAIAKMLGVRKMDILLLIENNPRLIHTEERFRSRTQRHSYKIGSQTIRQNTRVNGTSLGLCVIEAFPSVEENPWNPEWLEAAKRRLEKTLWLSDINNYGEILGHYFREDTHPSSIPSGYKYEDNRRNTWLWRNTKEKLETAKAIGGCHTEHFCMGGYGDSYIREEPYAVNAESLAILRQNGYRIL